MQPLDLLAALLLRMMKTCRSHTIYLNRRVSISQSIIRHCARLPATTAAAATTTTCS